METQSYQLKRLIRNQCGVILQVHGSISVGRINSLNTVFREASEPAVVCLVTDGISPVHITV